MSGGSALAGGDANSSLGAITGIPVSEIEKMLLHLGFASKSFWEIEDGHRPPKQMTLIGPSNSQKQPMAGILQNSEQPKRCAKCDAEYVGLRSVA